ncbi:peroxidasin-like [Ptychodera flava]|uniref:peroxidasin-like n=1 Tax=Ptychodera flava TaxID=63121 RepID=UPI003969D9A6
MALCQIFIYLLVVITLLYTDSVTEGLELNNALIRESIDVGRNAVDRAIMETRNAMLSGRAKTSNDLLKLFRFPTAETVEMARAEETFHAALEIIHDRDRDDFRPGQHQIHTPPHLTDSQIRDIITLSGCTDFMDDITCDDVCQHSKYRTPDGTCNNLEKPTQGASLTPFSRLLDPIYEDHFNNPRGWRDTRGRQPSLPSPRLVSTVVGSTHTVTNDDDLSDFVMLWGQFLDHDLDLTPQSPSSVAFKDGVKCSDTCENSAPCFSIPVPAGDPRINGECIEFIRSSAVCGTGYKTASGRPVPRQQVNAITSYIDASQIYGSSRTRADSLRAFDGKGSLGVNDDTEVPSGRPLLPYDPFSPMACISDSSSREIPCFIAGDGRANEQIGLISVHTLFLREHNRVSDKLSQINPHWDDTTLYQEARKIMGAQLQHIVYEHYLPKVLGPEGMDQLGTYQGYNPSIDASIVNVFATAAFRFGHGTVRPVVARLDENLNPIPEGNLPLHLAFFQPWRIVEQGGIDPILRGTFAKPAKQLLPDEIMTDELTERLFEMANTVALDLMALNIQRGRDHGLPSYTSWRRHCGLSSGNTFNRFRQEISNQDVLDKLAEVYDEPGDVDLFIGAMAEDPLPGGVLGPTFTCLLATQFKNTRAGDRFWYEKPGVFTEAQLAEIKKQSIARVICDNTDIDQVQADVFLNPTTERPLLDCSQIDGMDLTAWTYDSHSHTIPSVMCPDDVTTRGNRKGAVVTWDDPTATDCHGNSIGVTCSHTSGSRFPRGVTTVTCSTWDSSEICASCSFYITVSKNSEV